MVLSNFIPHSHGILVQKSLVSQGWMGRYSKKFCMSQISYPI